MIIKKNEKIVETLLASQGKDTRLLFFRVLDETLTKEVGASKSSNVAALLKKEIFLKSIFLCALETILFICNNKELQFTQILDAIELTAFDYWRVINSYLKFDPLMPCMLKNHFREIEAKIVSEIAWQKGSPIVDVVQQMI